MIRRLVKEIVFHSASDFYPRKDRRYLVIDSDDRMNIATFSLAEEQFVGWDVLANEPIGDVQWYADTEDDVYEERTVYEDGNDFTPF